MLPCGRAALLATACLVFPLAAGEPATPPSGASREVAARQEAVEEARLLLAKGDEAYHAAKFSEAAEAYDGARGLLPAAPVVADLRAAATERYALASVALARELARGGDVPGAREAIDKVLADGVAPDHALARLVRAELDDPIRTNPALTREHAADVDRVRRLLYTAEGAYNLADFDRSKFYYEEVLKIDPHNQAARRGMERVAAAKSGYYQAAFDHTRAEMLAQVDQAWELPVPLPAVDVPRGTEDAGQLDFVPVANKLDRIVIPLVNLEQASLEEALEFLRVRAAEHDTVALDPEQRGVNFALNLGTSDSEVANRIRNARFDLQLRNVPLSEILRYLTALTETEYRTDDYSVIVRPRGGISDAMMTRSYRVPPDFLSTLTAGATSDAGADADPFAEPQRRGLLAQRMGPQQALQNMGITFPEGAFARMGAGNVLVVSQTQANHDIIQQIVDQAAQAEPVMVNVKVQILRFEERMTQELGFDWLLAPTGFGGEGWVPGTNPMYLHGGTQGSGGDLTDIAVPFGQMERNPITAGNRSGTGAILSNSIDGVLGFERPTGAGVRAPGVFQLSRVAPSSSIQMLMRGLDQKKAVDRMATPSVVTRSGQEATIKVVREFIYPTEYEPPELPNSVGGGETIIIDGEILQTGSANLMPVTPATPTAFDTRDVGITLSVLPTASPDKRYVDVTLNPSYIEFDGFINYGTPINGAAQSTTTGGQQTVEITDNSILMPVFSNMNTQTSLTVADGATLVFSGLIQDTIQDVQDQTPVLGSLPVVGRLFQSKARQPISTVVVFLVTVELTDPAGRKFREP